MASNHYCDACNQPCDVITGRSRQLYSDCCDSVVNNEPREEGYFPGLYDPGVESDS